MPRKPRMFCPGIPVHVVQRGNNRQSTFFDKQDYCFYLEVLAQGLKRYKAALHAYVLMTNHVHLLITPSREDSIPRMMQHIGRRYVLFINNKYRRTGTLWEGRYKCSLVDADSYLLSCYRYIELNPVVARMVEMPEEYPWSSFRFNGMSAHNFIVTPHELYDTLGHDRLTRSSSYRQLFENSMDQRIVRDIQNNLSSNYPLGNDSFKEKIEKRLKRPIGFAKNGRPRKICKGEVA